MKNKLKENFPARIPAKVRNSLCERQVHIDNFVQGKCRTLKVVCNSSVMAKAVLKNWRSAQLPKNISIRSDKTPTQQKVLEDFNSSLAKHTDENTLEKITIKYIREQAPIVDASKRRKRNTLV